LEPAAQTPESRGMFRNITIRENTDRLLEILEPGRTGPERPGSPPGD
jgi:hypothetical protein